MAVAAFRSASKRATSSSSCSYKETKDYTNPTSTRKKTDSTPRRSRSVSAVSRSRLETSPSSDFLIKRDNPLYWSNGSPPDNENQDSLPVKTKSADAADNRRGRTVSRNSDVGKNVSKKIGNGRSLSRVDTGRCRSVSRGPAARAHFSNSESDVEQKKILFSKSRGRNDLGRVPNVGRESNLVRSSSSDAIDRIESLQTPKGTSCSPTASWEDGIFQSSFSGAEERTDTAFYDQIKSFQECDLGGDASSQLYETVRSEFRRAIADIQNDLESAIRRSNATAIAATNVVDIPPDMVNPSAVELVLDIRREYATKLKQSHERARKLRVDLAVEEQRGLELSRILKVLLEPKTSNVQKLRFGRKSSIERRRMSKRLTEEAMAYFDECVSLSTFDSSDFSSPEDPPISLDGVGAPVGDHALLSQASTSFAANQCLGSLPNDGQACGSTGSHDMSGQSAASSSKERMPDEISLNSLEMHWDRRSQFSFAHKQNDAFEFQHDVMKYVKNSERDVENVNVNSRILRSDYGNLGDYNLQASAQSLLFDTVYFKSKIEYGAMLLCGGGAAISLSPFASLV